MRQNMWCPCSFPISNALDDSNIWVKPILTVSERLAVSYCDVRRCALTVVIVVVVIIVIVVVVGNFQKNTRV